MGFPSERSLTCVLAVSLVLLTLLPSLAGAASPTACFAPGTPDVLMDRVSAESGLLLAPSAVPAHPASVIPGWTNTATDPPGLVRGEPITLTWSVIPDGVTIQAGPGVGDVESVSDLRAFLDGIYGSEATWLPLIQQALQSWSVYAGVRFVMESNDDLQPIGASSAPGLLGTRADIRIGGHAIDGNNNIVAYAYEPGGGDLVIDTVDSFYTANTSLNSRRLRNTVAHEIGHAIGLLHVWPTDRTKLMEPIVNTTFDGPQFDDVLGSTRNYGDPDEPNDSSANAPDVGVVMDGSADTVWLSLDGSSDEDWFSVVDAPGARLSASASPQGGSYRVSDADCTGESCPLFAAGSQRDLAIEIYASDGSTLLASADSAGLGASESLTNVLLPAGGVFVTVAGDVVDVAQLYDLQVSLVPEPATSLLGPVALVVLAILARRR